MAVCIAILTKDNCPLYLTCENTEDSLKMHFLVHTSIDVIEEKLNSTKAANDPRYVCVSPDLFLSHAMFSLIYGRNQKFHLQPDLPRSDSL